MVEQQVKDFESLEELLEDLEAKGVTGKLKKDIVFAYLGDRAKAKDRPIVASFELTPLCNFDCKMCYVHLNKDQMGNRDLLTVEQWKHIIDMVADAGIMAADITGGECLTYPGFKEVYLHLRSKGIHPCVLTNGSLLTEEMVAFFAAHPPKMIQVSLYGSCPSAYVNVTGCDAYSAVMSGIERLKQAKLTFKLILTPSRYMQEDADQLLERVRALGVDYGIGGIELPARHDTGRELQEYEIDVAYMAQIQKNEIMYRQSLMGEPLQEKQYVLQPAKRTRASGAPCGAAHNNCHINWKGELCPCISFHQVTSPILEKGFKNAWDEIRNQMAAFTEHAECRQCKFARICLSCPAEKCFGKPGERLNTSVCKRMQAYADVGLLGLANTDECIGGK